VPAINRGAYFIQLIFKAFLSCFKVPHSVRALIAIDSIPIFVGRVILHAAFYNGLYLYNIITAWLYNNLYAINHHFVGFLLCLWLV
jgi:hypothetical protein